MGFFLGIDGGGSKTECALADEAGVVLACAAGPGANLRRVPKLGLQATLGECVGRLWCTAGLPAVSPQVVCAGFAGAGRAEARGLARQVLTDLLHPRRLYVVGDMEIALEAAVGPGPGVVLVAGTGSIAYGRNRLDQQARAGGGGPREGDEGSGFDIGRHALEAVLHAHHGGAPVTPLTAVVLRSLKAEKVEGLEVWLRPEAAAELAALVPGVVAAARAGDRVAEKILQQAAAALAELAVAVLKELGLLKSEVRVATSGGVFAESEEVLAAVRTRILASAPQAVVERLRVTPAEGAVRLGQRLWLQEQVGGREPP